MAHTTSRRLRRLVAGLAVAVVAVVALAPTTAAVAAPPSALAGSTRATVTATTTTLTTARNPAYTAQPGGVVVRVRGSAALPIPTGTVDVAVDGQPWGTLVLDAGGRATLTYADLGPGSFQISASYSGDATHDASVSADLAQTVLATAPTTTLAFTPASVLPGATSRLVVSATNQTPVSMPNLAVGVLLPPGARIVKSPPGTGCRRALNNLYNCLTSAPRGVTRQIVVDVTAPAVPSTVTASGYSRNLDTMEETSASATLTVG